MIAQLITYLLIGYTAHFQAQVHQASKVETRSCFVSPTVHYTFSLFLDKRLVASSYSDIVWLTESLYYLFVHKGQQEGQVTIERIEEKN